MSTRGLNFLDRWIRNNVPKTARAGAISVDELTHKLIADARSIGIKRSEIDEEADSLHRTILDATVHYHPDCRMSARGPTDAASDLADGTPVTNIPPP
ncbi:hypothetical protein A9K65_013965 [Mesorhizobium sp. WSM1497]|nr:hypothetical protein A9K65_013965 [Mesorhizobium sp. WSM1497]